MGEELNLQEVRKVLEDADIYEPNMAEDMMVMYYNAINASKSTASEEDETRRLNESQSELLNLLAENEETPTKNNVKQFTPKTWTSEKKISDADIPERNNNQNKEDLKGLTNDSPKDATKDTFGFNEMAKDSDESLIIINHKLKFIPIQNSQNFLNAGITRKAKMLYTYHTKLNKMKDELARMSFYPAPLPKVMSVSNTFPNFSDDVDFQETYICRSGRQTKRKVYNYDEDDDSLDGSNNKKSKNFEEPEWLCKSAPNKTATRSKKSEANHITAKMDTSEVDTDGITTSSTATPVITTSTNNNESNKVLPKTETKPPPLKRLSNDDIMKRSRLFADTPKKRCELMFDKLKHDEEEKQRKEKAMEAFNKTLDKVVETDKDTIADDDVITVDDDDFKATRVVPPTPRRRRPINSRKRSLTPLNVTVNSSTQKNIRNKQNTNLNQDEEENSTKTTAKKRLSLRRSNTEDNGVETLPSTSQILKNESNSNMTCPICNGAFPADKIQEHASTCGDDPVAQSTSKISRITCEVCDKVVAPDTDYEAHVKECKAKKEGNL